MKLLFIFYLLCTIFPEQKGDFFYIGRFLYINNISRTFNYLTVSTADGFYVYDISGDKLLMSSWVKGGVKCAVFYNDRVYLITQDNRLAIYDGFLKRMEYTAFLHRPKSIGINGEVISVIDGESMRFFTRDGVEMKSSQDTLGMFWCGEKVNLKKDDNSILFLTPFKKYNPNVGWIDYSVFYPWMNLLYVGTLGDGIIIFDLQLKLPLDSLKLGLPEAEFRKILPCRENLWIISKNSLTLIEDAPVFKYFIAHRTPFLSCNNFVDGTVSGNKVYFLTEEGDIVSHDSFNWTVRKHVVDFPQAIYSKDGTLYIAEEQKLKVLTEKGNIESISIAGITEISSLGPFVLLLSNSGLYFAKGDSLFSLEDSLGYLNTELLHISQYNPHMVTIVTSQGIINLKDNLDYEYFVPPFSPWSCASLTSGKEKIVFGLKTGEIWVLSIKDYSWTKYKVPSPSTILSLYLQNDHFLYILTDLGLFLMRI